VTSSVLGIDAQTGQRVELPKTSRLQGLYIIGIQGTGKTGLIENLMLQDIKQGLGVGLLDPHGDLTNAVLSRLPAEREQDVVFLDLAEYRYPFGINLFTCADPSNPATVSEAASKVMHIFKKLWGKGGIVVEDAWGVLLEEILWNTTLTFLEASKDTVYTMAEIPLLLEEREFRNRVVNHITNRHVKRYWVHKYNPLSEKDQREEIRSTLNRVNAFLTQPIVEHIVGQARTTIDFRAIMDERKILLVKLSKRHEAVTALIGSMVIAELLNAAYSRTDLPVNKRKQFNIYADEFQNFATDDFTTLLEEARKFGIGISIAHQNRGQLEFSLKDRIRSVANLVVFKVNSKDAEELAGEFDITPQAAWEEEIEPEWVEIITPQWHERIEEQVEVEVEDDIEEISQNPVDYLISLRGTHPNRTVREIVQSLLYPLLAKLGVGKSYQEKVKQLINRLLVDIMEGRLHTRTDTFAERLIAMNKWYDESVYAYDELDMYRCDNPRKSKKEELIKKIAMRQEDMDAYLRQIGRQFGHNLIIHPFTVRYSQVYDKQLGRWIYEEWDGKQHHKRPDIEAPIERLLREIALMSDEEIDSKYRIRIEQLQDEIAITNHESITYRKWHYREFEQSVLDQLMKVASYYNQLITLCEELEQEPIKVPTGKKKMVKRIQPHITYLTHESEKITHPRKTIMHPQRTYADMLNEVASEIANLPVYTARVKVATDNGNEEHTIKTLDPKQEHDKPLFGQALQERKDRIKEQNIKDGYIREWTEVEAEIVKRQAQHSEDEPPVSRRSNR
jgi:hypothetical protein